MATVMITHISITTPKLSNADALLAWLNMRAMNEKSSIPQVR
ncbi:MAG: hypothetical protein RR413_09110 [Christensenellaceae bacterium]